MCGFVGAIGPGANGDLSGALILLGHRGPDDEGMERGDGWALGFRRLSILDLSPGGHQPMFSPDRRAVLVANGEIYNYKDLRKDLERDGEKFASTGDTEVLLRLLIRMGSGALPRLNGMFAFAYFDLKRRTFLLVRDRVGVKPLYYTTSGGTLRFASEMPALLALAGRTEVSPLAINRYLGLGHVPPPLTPWSGLFKLPPGYLAEGSLDRPHDIQIRRWWALELGEDESRDEDSWIEEMDALLARATSDRLASDVPLGTFLSGGIDSGLVCHYAKVARCSAPLEALTVVFGEEEFSEAEAARETARHLGLNHQIVKVEQASLSELPSMAWHAGEPFGDASLVNQFLLARAARPFATVFLTGDGGDEAFSGYTEYAHMARRGRLLAGVAGAGSALFSPGGRVLPRASQWAQRAAKLSGGAKGFGALVRNNFRDPLWPGLLNPAWRVARGEVEADLWASWEASAGAPLVKRMRRFDVECYLEPDVLVKVDRAAMAHSIEARSPFLDVRVVELAAKIPARFHVDREGGKRILRALALRHLPHGLASLPKRGFTLPIRAWLRHDPLAGAVREVLLGERARSRGWWDEGSVRTLLDASAKPTGRDLSDLVWRVLMLEIWARVFLDENREPWQAAEWSA